MTIVIKFGNHIVDTSKIGTCMFDGCKDTPIRTLFIEQKMAYTDNEYPSIHLCKVHSMAIVHVLANNGIQWNSRRYVLRNPRYYKVTMTIYIKTAGDSSEEQSPIETWIEGNIERSIKRLNDFYATQDDHIGGFISTTIAKKNIVELKKKPNYISFIRTSYKKPTNNPDDDYLGA